MTTLKWGLLGTARINRMLIPVLQASSRNTLAAVASRTPERAWAHAAEWQIPRAVAPYEALLDDPVIDVVYVSLPNSLHAEWTIRALEAGKHVLCEKPLALSVADVDAIAETAARTGRIAAEGFMYRHHPLNEVALAAARDGRLGELRVVRGAFSFTLDRQHDIRMDAALGGGSLWDVGCYPVSYACAVAGAAPSEVTGWMTETDGVDMAFAGMLRFGQGLVAQFDCAFNAPFRAEMEIVGSDATLRVERPFKATPESRLVLTRGDVVERLSFRPDAPYVGEVEDIASAILDNTSPRVTLAESRRTVDTICRLYTAARAARVNSVLPGSQPTITNG